MSPPRLSAWRLRKPDRPTLLPSSIPPRQETVMKHRLYTLTIMVITFLTVASTIPVASAPPPPETELQVQDTANANATPAAKAVLNYLSSLSTKSNKRLIAGQFGA